MGAVALYGLIEHLVRSRPRQEQGEAAPGGGVATNHDALEAVTQLATAIEVPAEAGDLAPDAAHRMASLLLVIRDYIEPVRSAADDDAAAERLSRYLAEVVDDLRQGKQPPG